MPLLGFGFARTAAHLGLGRAARPRRQSAVASVHIEVEVTAGADAARGSGAEEEEARFARPSHEPTTARCHAAGALLATVAWCMVCGVHGLVARRAQGAARALEYSYSRTRLVLVLGWLKPRGSTHTSHVAIDLMSTRPT